MPYRGGRRQIDVTLALMALLSGASAATADDPEKRPVQFIVSAPGDKTDAPELFCSLSIDNWPAGGRALSRVAPGLYAGDFELPVGTLLEYKFLHGKSWDAVEKGAGGEELANRTLTLAPGRERYVVFHAVARWADRPAPAAVQVVAAVEPAAGTPATTRPGRNQRLETGATVGDIRVHADFESPQLKNRRRVQVYLPPGYGASPDARYPVLYVHDGQNAFDASTSFQGVEWGLDEAAERLIAAGRIAPLIIVAVDNTSARLAEYTPVADSQRGGGGGEAYLDFLTQTLKPFIDKQYRTRPEREHTGILGLSLGGLISLHAVLSRSPVFGRAGVVSPAAFWGDDAIVTLAGKTPPARPVRLWIDMGDAEGSEVAVFRQARAACERLATALRSAGWQDSDFRYELIPGGRHHERDWAARADRVLAIFSRRRDAARVSPRL